MGDSNRMRHAFRYFEEAIAITAMLVLIVSVTAGILWRYVLNDPLIWTDELARVSFIWIAFIGASIGMKQHRHIEIDSLFNIFPPKVRDILQHLTLVLMFCFLSICFIFSLLLIKGTMYGSTAALGIPNIVYYSPISLGSFLMMVHIVRWSLRRFQQRPGV